MRIPSARPFRVVVALSFFLCSAASAQQAPESASPLVPSVQSQAKDKDASRRGNWYVSWGYSRQQYAPSDIHVSQPALGNDFTLRQVAGSDFPADLQETLGSITSLEFTNPQENVRIGRYLNAEKTFAIEFSLDHSKYNTNPNQTVAVSGKIASGTQPINGALVLSPDNFIYNLHNGLNHVMVNAVWLHHLYGPENQPGDLQLISRVGAGILLPHADNVIFGNPNQVGPKNQNVCCTGSKDWWQINGWTTGVELGVRYAFYRSAYLELTSKLAYGSLRGVPVYQGTADHSLWMSEQVLSMGFHF
jgi:hypothetical protein